jgi:hypothetical protein
MQQHAHQLRAAALAEAALALLWLVLTCPLRERAAAEQTVPVLMLQEGLVFGVTRH